MSEPSHSSALKGPVSLEDLPEEEESSLPGSRVIIVDRRLCRKLYPMRAALETQRQAFIAEHRGQAESPPRLVLHVGELEKREDTLFKPCVCVDRSTISLKVVSVRNKWPLSSFLVLMDSFTGQLRALLDADVITGRRTAAASGLATDLCASRSARVCTVFGAGVQGKEHIRAMLAVRPSIRKVYCIDRSLESAKRVCDSFSELVRRVSDSAILTGIEFIPFSNEIEYEHSLESIDDLASTVEDAVKESDVICTCTPSTSPLFQSEWLSSGVHLNCIGAYRPDMCEIDSATVEGCEMVLVDTLHALECGDLCNVKSLDLSKKHSEGGPIVRTLGEQLVDHDLTLSELDSLRQSRTLYDGVGFAAMDLFAAQFIFEQASELGKSDGSVAPPIIQL